MNMEQTKRYNRGRRLTDELYDVTNKFQKLRFFLDTTENISDVDKVILDTQASVMKEYIEILIKRIQQTIY